MLVNTSSPSSSTAPQKYSETSTINHASQGSSGSRPGAPPGTDRKLAAIKSSVPIQESFVMLSKSQVSPLLVGPHRDSGSGCSEEQKGSLSHRLKIAGKLFELMSGVSDVDHPLCQDCADELMVKLEKRLYEVRKEKEAYDIYLKALIEDEKKGGKSEVTEQDVAAVCTGLMVKTIWCRE